MTTQPKRTPREHKPHGGWGDSLVYTGIKTDAKGNAIGHRWYGFTPPFTPLMEVGDVIVAPLKSGATGRFTVTEVDYKIDPGDMFFATTGGPE